VLAASPNAINAFFVLAKERYPFGHSFVTDFASHKNPSSHHLQEREASLAGLGISPISSHRGHGCEPSWVPSFTPQQTGHSIHSIIAIHPTAHCSGLPPRHGSQSPQPSNFSATLTRSSPQFLRHLDAQFGRGEGISRLAHKSPQRCQVCRGISRL
jgi:hypothetical protein